MSVAEHEPGLRGSVARKGSFGRTISAVAWSFFGVRKSSDHAKDLEQINPLHLVIAAVIGAALFIAALIGVVSWVLSSGIAR